MILDDSIGWMDFEIGDKAYRVDLYTANDVFADAMAGVTEETPSAEVFKRLIAAAESVGVPGLSARSAMAMQDAVLARMKELRGKGPAAETPA